MPLNGLLPGLYTHGDRAVDLFFVLSGFVFYWLYSAGIHSQRFRPRQFALLRVSRLFPLHILTFGLVVGLQALYIHGNHSFFVYPCQGLFLGIRNLLGISSWLPHARAVFDGPFWSVSIELLLYLLFFLLCRFVSPSWWAALLMVILGMTLRHAHPDLMRGMVGYFLGGLAYYAFGWIASRESALSWLVGMGLLSLMGWVAMAILASVIKKELQTDLVFAASLIFLLLLERRFHSAFSRLSWMGDISYSIYLIHFPLQIAVVLGNQALGGKSGIFYQAWAFPLFLGILVPLGFLSYHLFELPAQRFLRSRFRGSLAEGQSQLTDS